VINKRLLFGILGMILLLGGVFAGEILIRNRIDIKPNPLEQPQIDKLNDLDYKSITHQLDYCDNKFCYVSLIADGKVIKEGRFSKLSITKNKTLEDRYKEYVNELIYQISYIPPKEETETIDKIGEYGGDINLKDIAVKQTGDTIK
jgi:hypothetical protein